MNSSILHIGQTLLAVWALVHTLLLLRQFGWPSDTVRVLANLFMGSLTAMLVIEALSWWGVFAVFYYPAIYAVLLGILGTAWPAFLWLGVLERPTQLQRKFMWRVPILGGLLGHALGLSAAAWLLAAGWLLGLGVVVWSGEQRFVLRSLLAQLAVSLVYGWLLRAGALVPALFCFALWIVFANRIVNAFLVKNLVRETLHPVSREVTA